MPVTVKRFGGLMPLAKEKTFALQDLDLTTRKALGALLDKPTDRSVAQRVPDGFTYRFELTEDDAAPRETAVSGANVPSALRKLLP